MALVKHYLREGVPSAMTWILPSMSGISWASATIKLMEHGMIVEGESIQTASEKCPFPFDNSSLVSSLRNASSRGSGGDAMFGGMNGDTNITSSSELWLR